MITDFLKFIDMTKLPIRWWAIFVTVGLLVLLSPDEYAAIFGLAENRNELRPYIGGITLLSIAVLLVNGANYVWKRRQTAQNRIKIEATAIRHLDSLSIEEVAILGKCYHQDQRTVMLPIMSAHANSLVSKGIMRRLGGTGDFREWPFTVNEFIWDHLPMLMDRFPVSELQPVFQKISDWQRPLKLV